MRIKKYFYFDEKKIAEDVIRNGFDQKGIDYGKMYIIAKYFKEVLGYEGEDLEKELVSFCQKHDPSFNQVINAASIKRWVSGAQKYKLRKIDYVTITEKEIAYLSQVHKSRERKILFIMLILAKARKKGNTRITTKEYRESNNYYIKYNNFADIIRLSGISRLTENRIKEILNNNLNMITLYFPEKELIKLEYADPEGIGFDIYDLENLPDSYEIFFGKDLNRCEECGKVYSKTGRWQKYCPSCARNIKKEQDRINIREKRRLVR